MATDPANPDEQPSPVAQPASETPSDSPPPPTTEPAPQPSARPPRIAIGSQRDVADKSPALPKAVEAAKANPVQIAEPAVETPEPEIGSMIGLGEDLDAEIEAALKDVSMESIVDATNATETDLAPNSRVKGSVTRIHGDNVFIKLMGQYEGVASLGSFKNPPAVDELVEVVVRGQNADDGLYEVAIPGSSVDVSDWEDLNEGDVVECRVTGSNTGGLEVSVNSLRGFIPASQIDRFRVENFGDYVNQKLQCVVMELNPDRRKLVLSRRAVLERENEEKRKKLMESIEPGQEYDGIITKLMDFGAFVDIGGTEGLVHISKLAWDRVQHPQDVVEVGQKIKVKVEKIDRVTGKISLSYRDTMENPWNNIAEKFPPQSVVPGTVTKIAQFGAFVQLAPGIEGLVHISEIAHHRVVAVKNHFKPGDEVQVKILGIDSEKQKISLSIKATVQPPKKKETARKDEVEEIEDRPLAVSKHDGELKGGRDRKSGGESIGLNW